MIDINELRVSAANSVKDLALLPSEVLELLDRLEAAEKEGDTMRTKISDLTINAEYLGNLKKSYEELIGELQDERDTLRAALQHEADCVEAGKAEIDAMRAEIECLRARIEEMEKQESVAWLHETRRDSDVVTTAVKHVWGKVTVGSMAAYSIPLYLAPGAKGEEK